MATFHSVSVAGCPSHLAFCVLGALSQIPPLVGFHSPVFGSMIFSFVKKLLVQCWPGGFLLSGPTEFFLVKCSVGGSVQAS